MVAAKNSHLEVVKALLAKGADVNAKLNNGETALTLASFGDWRRRASSDEPVEVVRVLLTNGANVNAKGSDGKTALDMANEGGQDVIRALLVRAGAKR